MTKNVRYPDALGKPLVRHRAGRGGLLAPTLTVEQAIERDFADLIVNLVALAEHYEAMGENRKIDWKALAMGLAFDHVPGFQFVDTPSRPRGRPRRFDGLDLYLAILQLLDERSTSIANACRILSRRKGPWQGTKPATLETKFHADKRRLEKLQQRPKVDYAARLKRGGGGLLNSAGLGDVSESRRDRPSAKYPAPLLFGLPAGFLERLPDYK